MPPVWCTRLEPAHVRVVAVQVSLDQVCKLITETRTRIQCPNLLHAHAIATVSLHHDRKKCAVAQTRVQPTARQHHPFPTQPTPASANLLSAKLNFSFASYLLALACPRRVPSLTLRELPAHCTVAMHTYMANVASKTHRPRSCSQPTHAWEFDPLSNLAKTTKHHLHDFRGQTRPLLYHVPRVASLRSLVPYSPSLQQLLQHPQHWR
mmetsp:Transcript_27126/g.48109  ORF Transcript_27126/g.48109 Transcript_27126/m.48109 type:complete len:208 (+) Transcript_27126:108-731(+)